MNDLIMLATLLPGPKHGYQLKREAGFVFGDEALHNNLVYPMLRRFTGDGWVTKKPTPGERGQTRQQYSITPLGKKILLDRLTEFGEADARSFDAFTLRAGMFELLDQPAREHILSAREAYLQQRIAKLTALPQKMDTGTYGTEAIELIKEKAQVELSWIRRIRRLTKSEAEK
jgi:DNA-binding PadR family transcriptional regulator